MDMPRTYDTLTLEDDKRMLCAAEAKAVSFEIPYNVAVVDAGGHLVAFSRQDGALIASIASTPYATEPFCANLFRDRSLRLA
jgi:uncharacterized protein GlcG (DUF336 family)